MKMHNKILNRAKFSVEEKGIGTERALMGAPLKQLHWGLWNRMSPADSQGCWLINWSSWGILASPWSNVCEKHLTQIFHDLCCCSWKFVAVCKLLNFSNNLWSLKMFTKLQDSGGWAGFPVLETTIGALQIEQELLAANNRVPILLYGIRNLYIYACSSSACFLLAVHSYRDRWWTS